MMNAALFETSESLVLLEGEVMSSSTDRSRDVVTSTSEDSDTCRKRSFKRCNRNMHLESSGSGYLYQAYSEVNSIHKFGSYTLDGALPIPSIADILDSQEFKQATKHSIDVDTLAASFGGRSFEGPDPETLTPTPEVASETAPLRESSSWSHEPLPFSPETSADGGHDQAMEDARRIYSSSLDLLVRSAATSRAQIRSQTSQLMRLQEYFLTSEPKIEPEFPLELQSQKQLLETLNSLVGK